MLDNGEQSLRARLSGLFIDDAPRTLAVRVFNIALANSHHRQRHCRHPRIRLVDEPAIFPDLCMTIERVATTIFVAEYLLRVWTAVDYRGGRFRDPLWGRLEYMRLAFR